MTCGLPVIVPTVGGIAELVEDGYNGFKIDVQNLDKIKCCIGEMMRDYGLYTKLSTNAMAESQKHSIGCMLDNISTLIE